VMVEGFGVRDLATGAPTKRRHRVFKLASVSKDLHRRHGGGFWWIASSCLGEKKKKKKKKKKPADVGTVNRTSRLQDRLPPAKGS